MTIISVVSFCRDTVDGEIEKPDVGCVDMLATTLDVDEIDKADSD